MFRNQSIRTSCFFGRAAHPFESAAVPVVPSNHAYVCPIPASTRIGIVMKVCLPCIDGKQELKTCEPKTGRLKSSHKRDKERHSCLP